MARRRKKRVTPEEVVYKVTVATIFFVFVYRLMGQEVTSIDALGSLLISSALWVVVPAVLICIAYFGIKKANANNGIKPSVTSVAKSNAVQKKGNANPSSPNLFKQSLFNTQQAEKAPNTWSHELIDDVEWRVFEKICMGLWQAKGFEIEETANGGDGGVDFYLCAKDSKVRIGAVQCKSWKTKQIDVKVIRELQGVVAAENLRLGLVMYSGKLSKGANDFINRPTVTIKQQGTKQIFEQIQRLDIERQQQLLDATIVGDYLTPSCPNCDVKLVIKKAKKSGKEFKACPNFPRCRYTMY